VSQFFLPLQPPRPLAPRFGHGGSARFLHKRRPHPRLAAPALVGWRLPWLGPAGRYVPAAPRALQPLSCTRLAPALGQVARCRSHRRGVAPSTPAPHPSQGVTRSPLPAVTASALLFEADVALRNPPRWSFAAWRRARTTQLACWCGEAVCPACAESGARGLPPRPCRRWAGRPHAPSAQRRGGDAPLPASSPRIAALCCRREQLLKVPSFSPAILTSAEAGGATC
jgi:hypothetical protein